MRNPHQIILMPRVTEKATADTEHDLEKIHFQVDLRADKIQIRRAIEEIYDVEVESVNVVRVKGKKKRLGRFEGRRSNWKKAIVTLKDGYSINLYEG